MRRGKMRWTQADDKRLGHALLDVFTNMKEVVTPSDSRALWKCVQQRYQELIMAEQNVTRDLVTAQRSARSLHTRWARDIRPELVLFASLVDKVWRVPYEMQKAGKKPVNAMKQAVTLFRGRRNAINAAAVRKFVQERQRTSATSSDSETESAPPKLKYESFHFRHCYDILCSNAAFMEAMLEPSRTNRDSEPLQTCRQLEGGSGVKEMYSFSTQSDDGFDAAEMHASEKRIIQCTRASQVQVMKAGSISKEHPPSWQKSSATANGVKRAVHPCNTTQRSRGSVTVTFEDASDNLELPRLECDRAVITEYMRLRIQTLKEDRRLKLLAELRGIVTTISQLAQQLAWNGVASAALAARTGDVCSGLDQDVLRDIAFFRHEKQRLKQEIADLNGPVPNDTSSK